MNLEKVFIYFWEILIWNSAQDYESIELNIKNLDKKSQESLEKISYEIANKIAEFLYERDNDILLLSKLELNQKTLEKFYEVKNKNITIHGKYYYYNSSSEYKNNEKIVKSRETLRFYNQQFYKFLRF